MKFAAYAVLVTALSTGVSWTKFINVVRASDQGSSSSSGRSGWSSNTSGSGGSWGSGSSGHK